MQEGALGVGLSEVESANGTRLARTHQASFFLSPIAAQILNPPLEAS